MYIEHTKTGVIVYYQTIKDEKYTLGGWSKEYGLSVEELR